MSTGIPVVSSQRSKRTERSKQSAGPATSTKRARNNGTSTAVSSSPQEQILEDLAALQSPTASESDLSQTLQRMRHRIQSFPRDLYAQPLGEQELAQFDLSTSKGRLAMKTAQKEARRTLDERSYLHCYLTQSPHISEIFSLWGAIADDADDGDNPRGKGGDANGGKQSIHHFSLESQVHLDVLQLLSCVLLHNVFDATRHLSAVLARRVLQGHAHRLSAAVGLTVGHSASALAMNLARVAVQVLRRISNLSLSSTRYLLSRFTLLNPAFLRAAHLRKAVQQVGPDEYLGMDPHSVATEFVLLLVSLMSAGDGVLWLTSSSALILTHIVHFLFGAGPRQSSADSSKGKRESPLATNYAALAAVVQALDDTLLQNPRISRGCKVGVFPLKMLSKLARFPNIGDFAEFLIRLCSIEHGISFRSKRLVRDMGEIRNKNVLAFLLKLQPSAHASHAHIISAVIRSQPDLYLPYLSSIPFSLSPEASTVWFQNISFVQSLTLHIPLPPLHSLPLASLVESFLPSHCFSLEHFQAGLSHSNPSVQFATLSLLITLLQKLQQSRPEQRVVPSLKDSSSSDEKFVPVSSSSSSSSSILPISSSSTLSISSSSSLPSTSTSTSTSSSSTSSNSLWEEFLMMVSQHLPSFKVVLNLLNESYPQDPTAQRASTVTSSSSTSATSKKNTATATPPLAEYLTRLEQEVLSCEGDRQLKTWPKWLVFDRTLCLMAFYQTIYPHAVLSSQFISAFPLFQLLRRGYSLQLLPSALVKQLFTLQLDHPAGSINWHQQIESQGANKRIPKSYLGALLERYFLCKQQQQQSAPGELKLLTPILHRYLLRTDFFRHQEHDIWLQSLDSAPLAFELASTIKRCSDKVQLFTKPDFDVCPLLVCGLHVATLENTSAQWRAYISRVVLHSLFRVQYNLSALQSLVHTTCPGAQLGALKEWLDCPLPLSRLAASPQHSSDCKELLSTVNAVSSIEASMYCLRLLAEDSSSPQAIGDINQILDQLLESPAETSFSLPEQIIDKLFLKFSTKKLNALDVSLVKLFVRSHPSPEHSLLLLHRISASNLSPKDRLSLFLLLSGFISSQMLHVIMEYFWDEPALFIQFFAREAQLASFVAALSPELFCRLLEMARKYAPQLDVPLKIVIEFIAARYHFFGLIKAAIAEGKHVEYCFRAPTGPRVAFLKATCVLKSGRALCQQLWTASDPAVQQRYKHLFLPLLTDLVDYALLRDDVSPTSAHPLTLGGLSSVFSDDLIHGRITGSISELILLESPSLGSKLIKRTQLESYDLIILFDHLFQRPEFLKAQSDLAKMYLAALIRLPASPQFSNFSIPVEIFAQMLLRAFHLVSNASQSKIVSRALKDMANFPFLFLKTLLKAHFLDPDVHLLLSHLTRLAVGDFSQTIASMVLSHSRFVATLLEGPQSTPPSLLRLVFLTMDHIPPALLQELFTVSLLRILLTVYSATLSELDQILLQIFAQFEEKLEISILRAGLYWGTLARDQLANALPDSPEITFEMATEILDHCLDVKMMYHSAIHFPLSRGYDPFEPFEFPAHLNPASVYDPCFLLNILSEVILSPYFDAQKFADSGALGYALVSLSSEDRHIRRLAGAILSYVTRDIQKSQRFSERRLLGWLLHLVRNSLGSPGAHLSSLLAVFALESIRIVLHPAHFLYVRVNQFLLSSPVLNAGEIPLFGALLHSGEHATAEKDRLWILKFLTNALRSEQEYALYQKNQVFEIVQSLHHSPFVSNALKDQVSMIHRALIGNLPQKLSEIISKTGVCLWLISCFQKSTDELAVIPYQLLIMIMKRIQAGNVKKSASLHFVSLCISSLPALYQSNRYSPMQSLEFLQTLQTTATTLQLDEQNPWFHFHLSTPAISSLLQIISNPPSNSPESLRLSRTFFSILKNLRQPLELTPPLISYLSSYLSNHSLRQLSEDQLSSLTFKPTSQSIPTWFDYLVDLF